MNNKAPSSFLEIKYIYTINNFEQLHWFSCSNLGFSHVAESMTVSFRCKILYADGIQLDLSMNCQSYS